jgi:hypothetical protein
VEVDRRRSGNVVALQEEAATAAKEPAGALGEGVN